MIKAATLEAPELSEAERAAQRLDQAIAESPEAAWKVITQANIDENIGHLVFDNRQMVPDHIRLLVEPVGSADMSNSG